MILEKIFENKQKGFFVDVEVLHPKRSSNTYFFYKQGWRRINIDARPGSMKLFDKLRKRDINLEIAVSDIREELKFFILRK